MHHDPGKARNEIGNMLWTEIGNRKSNTKRVKLTEFIGLISETDKGLNALSIRKKS